MAHHDLMGNCGRRCGVRAWVKFGKKIVLGIVWGRRQSCVGFRAARGMYEAVEANSLRTMKRGGHINRFWPKSAGRSPRVLHRFAPSKVRPDRMDGAVAMETLGEVCQAIVPSQSGMRTCRSCAGKQDLLRTRPCSRKHLFVCVFLTPHGRPPGGCA